MKSAIQGTLDYWKEKGLAEGRAEGRAEGLAEGRAEGKVEGRAEAYVAMYRKGRIPADEAAQEIGKTVEEFLRLVNELPTTIKD